MSIEETNTALPEYIIIGGKLLRYDDDHGISHALAQLEQERLEFIKKNEVRDGTSTEARSRHQT